MPKSFIYKPTATKPVPPNAKISKGARGEDFAIWESKGRRLRKRVHRDRKGEWRYRWERDKYLMRLYLPSGRSVIEDTGCTDRSSAQSVMVRRCTELELEHAYPNSRSARRAIESSETELTELLSKYVDVAIKSHDESTYRMTTRRYVEACIKSCNWSTFGDISGNGLEDWIAHLKGEGRKSAYLRHAVGAVKRFSRWSARRLEISHDPLAMCRMPPKCTPDTPRAILTAPDLKRLRSAALRGSIKCRSPRSDTGRACAQPTSLEEANAERSLIYAVMFETGLRVSQIRRLEPGHLQQGAGGGWLLQVVNPEGRKRHHWGEVAISEQLAKEITDHLDRLSSSAPTFMFRWPPNMLKRFYADLKEAGIEHRSERGLICLHSLRHSANAMLESLNAPPAVRQRQLGHSTPLMVQTVYAPRRDLDEVRPYVEQLAKQASGQGSPGPSHVSRQAVAASPSPLKPPSGTVRRRRSRAG